MATMTRSGLITFLGLATLFTQVLAAQQSVLTDLTKLVDEVGQATVDGAGVLISLAEGSDGFRYVPDENNEELIGKKFRDATGDFNGNSNVHATVVARNFVGANVGVARGAVDITCFDATGWLNDIVLNGGADPIPMVNNDADNSNPNPQLIEVINHSWIITFDDIDVQTATEVLRRADFMANRDNVTIVVGANNGGTTTPLMAPGYNSITVGTTSGSGAEGPTTFYGSGRHKPEIVAPANATSFATPQVSGSVALLRQNAPNANGKQNEVTKATLLAGATKEEFSSWNRTTTRPFDTTFGVGELNHYNSFRIITGGEFDGTDAMPGPAIGFYGWDYAPSITSEKFYTLDAPFGITKASILLTWNIKVTDNNSSPNVFAGSASLSNMNLQLLDSSGAVVDESVSPQHNIEHVYVQNLPADTYTIRVTSNTDYDYALAWRIHAAQFVPADSFVVASGTLAGGTSADLNESDDVDVSARRSTTDVQSRVYFELDATSPTADPVSISFTVEGSVFARTNVVQSMDLWDYSAGVWEEIDSQNATRFIDSVVVANGTGDLSRFVEPGTRQVRARVRYLSDIARQRFTANVDQMVWVIE